MTVELTDIAKAIAARVRKTYEFDIGKHLGFGPDVHAVKIRVLTKREQDLAWIGAHEYVGKLADKDPSKVGDNDLLQDTKAAFIVAAACREAKRPEAFPAWPGGAWVCDNLTADQIGALLNLINIVRAKDGPYDNEIHDGRVEAYATMAADNAGNDVPDAALGMLSHAYLTQLYVLTALKLREARSMLADTELTKVEAEVL